MKTYSFNKKANRFPTAPRASEKSMQSIQFNNNRSENIVQKKLTRILNSSQNLIQLKTSIAYGTAKKFTLPDENKTTIDVASGAYAEIDPAFPEQGTDTSGFTGWGNALKTLRIKTKDSWVAGHLINHDLGGKGILNNFFPITKDANKDHLWKVENNLKQWLSDNHKFKYIVETKQYSDQSASGQLHCRAQVTSPAPGKPAPSNINEIIKSVPKTASQKAKEKKAAKAAKAAKKKKNARRAEVPKKWKHVSGNQVERKAVEQAREKAKKTNSSARYLYLEKGKWKFRKKQWS